MVSVPDAPQSVFREELVDGLDPVVMHAPTVATCEVTAGQVE
jgi:hypothetical protein